MLSQRLIIYLRRANDICLAVSLVCIAEGSQQSDADKALRRKLNRAKRHSLVYSVAVVLILLFSSPCRGANSPISTRKMKKWYICLAY